MRSEKRKKEFSEVFTPISLVNEVLNKISNDLWLDPNKTWLDNSCGNGNFLVEVKQRLLKKGHSLENVLSRIYGVDLMQDNIDECRERLDPDNKYFDIMKKNIVCADGLRYHYRFDNSYIYDPVSGTPQKNILEALGICCEENDITELDINKHKDISTNIQVASKLFNDLFN